MDLSKDGAAVVEPRSTSVEAAQETVADDSSLTPAPASCDSSSQPDIMSVPSDTITDLYLYRTDEQADELVSELSVPVPDPQTSEVEVDHEDKEAQPMIPSDSVVCDSEESRSQISTMAVNEVDNHRPVQAFYEQLEHGEHYRSEVNYGRDVDERDGTEVDNVTEVEYGTEVKYGTEVGEQDGTEVGYGTEVNYSTEVGEPEGTEVKYDTEVDYGTEVREPDGTEVKYGTEVGEQNGREVGKHYNSEVVEHFATEVGAAEGRGLMHVESSLIRGTSEESQQLSCDLGSRSQSPMSFVVQINEDSECSLQSLPAGEHGPTNFSMVPTSEHRPTNFGMVPHSEHAATNFGSLVRGDESYVANVGHMANVGHIMAEEYLEGDSRCSPYSERLNEETDLLMEVETGSSAMSEPLSVKDSCTTLDVAKTTNDDSQKSSGRADDRNKSRIRKRLLVDTAPADTEDRFVYYHDDYLAKYYIL